ncbi:uracil-xanthine permease family protein [Methanoculleus sp. 7T]|jgi:xanthine/uracil permease|uniref:uracil-xanthine permease family protein n=1 Tax=Methanoculleus sp. 7T TaxID=2937282 RepID=UPI0020BF9BFC|nr:solute carrier family 23 protein [Methanoculleus sp. 7T]MCK8517777.1 purine/pyrimidine permease [Methanoculleus sp. 7T]
MEFTYGIDDRPGPAALLIFGLQWLAVSVPAILIIGKVVAALQTDGSAISYLQRLFLLIALVMLVQLYLGHKLPLVIGPATVLLIGILASLDQGFGAINASLVIGGLLLAGLAAAGLFDYLKRLFTPRVIVVVLMLIAFTLAPVILNLITDGGGTVPATHTFLFALAFALVLFLANGFLKGIWKSTLALWAIILGTLAYVVLFGAVPLPPADIAPLALPGGLLAPLAVPDVGVLAAFLICFLALAVNDLGSIQSVGGLLKADAMGERVNRGVTVTGLGNALAGITGVIGPVNFSLSPGVIAATGCASRFALVPAAVALGLVAASPLAIGYLSSIPGPVIGVVLAYVMAAQIAAGLMLGQESSAVGTFDEGLIIGIPLLLGTVVAFLPAAIAAGFPATVRPLIANGFVVGVIAVLVLEHIVYRRPQN